jgi:hypothetical protein
LSRPRGTNWRKDAKRRRKSWGHKVDRANAEYDKLHGAAKVIQAEHAGPRGPVRLRPLGYAGTLAPFPGRPEHRLTPPWIALADDPPFPAPRQDLIALAQKCFPWEQSL